MEDAIEIVHELYRESLRETIYRQIADDEGFWRSQARRRLGYSKWDVQDEAEVIWGTHILPDNLADEAYRIVQSLERED